MYIFKNLDQLKEMPDFLKNDHQFQKLFEIAELSNMRPIAKTRYERSLLQLWNENGARDGLIEEGLQKGMKKGLEQGLEQGLQQGRKMVEAEKAKNNMEKNKAIQMLLRNGFLSISEIAATLSVSESRVAAMKASIESKDRDSK